MSRAAQKGLVPESHEFAFSDDDFATIVKLVRATAGIALSDRKRELVYNRLSRRIRQLGMTDFASYCRYLEEEGGQGERGELVNAITTNMTSFFREAHHFEALAREILPSLVTQPRVRIWSAGCSTGEEPYSIAMVLKDMLEKQPCADARILATDIDTKVLEKAARGIYPAASLTPVPAELRRKYVTSADPCEIAAQVKNLVSFRQLNLFSQWPMKGLFDIVFCRNVVIYFDKPTQRALFENFSKVIKPNGWLIIGHSESLFEISDAYHHLGRTIYRRIG